MGHARLAPSGSSRWMACPGSVRLEAPLPDTDNEHTLRGTAAHWVAEQGLKGEQTAGYWTGHPVEVERVDGTRQDILMNQEDTRAILAYQDYVWTRKDQLGVDPLIETEVDAGWWLGQRDDIKGTADCIFFGDKLIEVIDYKHGSGQPVEAENNTQLLLYAIGAASRINWEGVNPADWTVQMTVVQPRCPHPDGSVRSWVIPMADLLSKYIPDLTAAAVATDDPNAPLVPGKTQCRWCKAESTCPARQQQVMDVFKSVQMGVEKGSMSGNSVQVQNLPKTDWDIVETNLGKPANVLDDATLENILDKADLIKAWLKASLEEAVARALKGTQFTRHKLVSTITKRKWSLDDEAMIERLTRSKDLNNKNLKKSEVSKLTCLSIAQAEKLIKPRVSPRTWNNIESLAIKPEGKPTLVPLTDSREPIKTVEEVFEPVKQALPWE